MLTRARPIMRAAAVVAVRWGFRPAFCWARRPATPYVRRAGHPSIPVRGPATTGLSRVTPTKTPMAPTASIKTTEVVVDATNRPNAPAAVPAATRAAPIARRVRLLMVPAAAPSRRATITGTREALRAGPMAETRVTPIPTTAATSTVRPETITGESGNSAPMAPNSARKPKATPTPTPMPRPEASRPITPASAKTARRSWAGSAPTVRSKASSLVR